MTNSRWRTLEEAEVVNDPTRDQSDVHVGGGDEEQAGPRPQPVPGVRLTHPAPDAMAGLAGRRLSEAVDAAAHRVAERVTTDREEGERDHAGQQEQRAEADAEPTVEDE